MTMPRIKITFHLWKCSIAALEAPDQISLGAIGLCKNHHEAAFAFAAGAASPFPRTSETVERTTLILTPSAIST